MPDALRVGGSRSAAASMLKFKAAIFGLDGILIDSEQILMREWLAAARSLGYRLSADGYARVIGHDPSLSGPVLTDLLGSEAAFRAVQARVRAALQALPGARGFPLKPGVKAVLRALRDRAIPCAVASSSTVTAVAERLCRAGLSGYFGVTVGGDEVASGEPGCALHRLAALRLGIPSVQCLSFEHGALGAESAADTGASVVLIPDIRVPAKPVLRSAVVVLRSLADAANRLDEWFE